MIKVICVGKVKDGHLLALIEDYRQKISHYHKLEIIEVRDEPIRENEKQVLDTEAQRLLNVIDQNDYVILLDLHGKSIDSLGFSKKLDQLFFGTWRKDPGQGRRAPETVGSDFPASDDPAHSSGTDLSQFQDPES